MNASTAITLIVCLTALAAVVAVKGLDTMKILATELARLTNAATSLLAANAGLRSENDALKAAAATAPAPADVTEAGAAIDAVSGQMEAAIQPATA